MTARRLVYWTLVAGPAIVLGSVAMEARWYPPAQAPPESTPAQRARIKAYGALVRLTESRLAVRHASMPELRDLAEGWLAEQRRGILRPLYPASPEDTIRDGPKGQIFAAKRQLANRLTAGAARNLAEPDEAAEDLARALLVSEVVKYSDLEAAAVSAEDQRRAVAWLASISSGISQARRKYVSESLKVVLARQESLPRLVAITLRNEQVGRISANAIAGQADSALHFGRRPPGEAALWTAGVRSRPLASRIRAAVAAQDFLRRDILALSELLRIAQRGYLAGY